MPIIFNSILREAKLSLSDVRLLRHKDTSSEKGRSPYELWRDDRPQFDRYQSTQLVTNRTKLDVRYWASFLGTPSDETLFVGLYEVKSRRLMDKDTPKQHMEGMDKAGTCDLYRLAMIDPYSDLVGRLYIDWGLGKRSWIQRADSGEKPIVEIRPSFQEPEFPGFLNFIQPLSNLGKLPRSWVSALQSSRGIYLLTCPKTKEQYVGAAIGADGFWARWTAYAKSGHGGNVMLKSRDPSDYQVSILEVAGSALSIEEIIAKEQHWKAKLQSREMGLNRN